MHNHTVLTQEEFAFAQMAVEMGQGDGRTIPQGLIVDTLTKEIVSTMTVDEYVERVMIRYRLWGPPTLSPLAKYIFQEICKTHNGPKTLQFYIF